MAARRRPGKAACLPRRFRQEPLRPYDLFGRQSMRALFRLTVFLCVLALCCPLGATAVAKADKDKVEEDFEALRRFSQVLDLVNRYYVKDVNQGELLDGALKGMLQGLDPHSTFMTPEEHKEMQETTSGEFTGIGIEITVENGQVTDPHRGHARLSCRLSPGTSS